MGLLGCVFYPERGMIPTVSTYERSGGRKKNEVAFDYRQSCAGSKHFGKRPSAQVETAWLEDSPCPLSLHGLQLPFCPLHTTGLPSSSVELPASNPPSK